VTGTSGRSEQEAAMARRHRTTAATCLVIVLAMAGLSYAAVPLYRLYCQVTGYAGTTQRADKASNRIVDRMLTVHFDANVADELPWTFGAAATRTPYVRSARTRSPSTRRSTTPIAR
jgi:cytochrome c oxidase assembly protein subunit 11